MYYCVFLVNPIQDLCTPYVHALKLQKVSVLIRFESRLFLTGNIVAMIYLEFGLANACDNNCGHYRVTALVHSADDM